MELTGSTLGTYQIMEELGRGETTIVYRAYQPSLNRYVAIKVLPPHLSRNQEFVDRFEREARAAANLRHPNIVVIHDVGQEDGTHYIVMEFLEGRTLKDLVEEAGPLAPHRAAHILEQVAAALDYAHQRGFVHRAVKPADIFVDQGDRVTVTGFGIARAAPETGPLADTGTLEYLSPEQAGGEPVDNRTDLYALGVVLYEMLTGRAPFRSTTPQAILHSIVYEAPPPPRQMNPSLPPALSAVVLKAMAKQPEARYQRGSELVKDLRRALSGAPISMASPPIPPPQWGPVLPPEPARRRSPIAWILAGIAAVLILLIAGVLLIMALGGERRATPSPSPSEAIALTTETPAGGEVTPGAGTATGEEPSPTSTESPTSTASPSPTLTEEPSATAEPATNTPLPPSDTPSSTPTHTPTATRTPTATPSPLTCAFDAHGTFAGLWNSYKEELGCPAYAEPKAIQDAEQSFENGHMFWRQDNARIYVVYDLGPRSGTYQGFADTWSEGNPDYACSATPPPGLVQPIRGFGVAWCDLGGPSAPIGWGLGDEAGFWPGNGDPLVQDFEHGVIFRDSDGTTAGLAYVLFRATGEFVRVGY